VSGLLTVPPSAPAASATFSVAMSCTPPQSIVGVSRTKHNTIFILAPIEDAPSNGTQIAMTDSSICEDREELSLGIHHDDLEMLSRFGD
jgi:hypothetical protein